MWVSHQQWHCDKGKAKLQFLYLSILTLQYVLVSRAQFIKTCNQVKSILHCATGQGRMGTLQMRLDAFVVLRLLEISFTWHGTCCLSRSYAALHTRNHVSIFLNAAEDPKFDPFVDPYNFHTYSSFFHSEMFPSRMPLANLCIGPQFLFCGIVIVICRR